MGGMPVELDDGETLYTTREDEAVPLAKAGGRVVYRYRVHVEPYAADAAVLDRTVEVKAYTAQEALACARDST